ncbi:hemagglutinin repeat-containing protein [Paludibacterium sp. THUN1379]|uniref:hemagglutinin repeat-containing protein n=1 Tax=Paludibacterium sp. THUN1379 TaxID=3112107 RepID=UPI00308D77C5|nr:hemagglutinin repeat-containing protein [Paludibacterium sp. THUN1379]
MKAFKLSSHGQIASALALSLLCSPRLWAEGIQPVAGSATQVQQVGAVPVVNIAPANAQGLSHNQYQDYNVGRGGVVLNNAIEAGRSQLAGALQGNAALAGRPAAVILNEVVSRNPSLLLGQQEVFGKAADLILANPNGITCQGCGFINTRRASLLVGSPGLQDGRLQQLVTASPGSTLSIGKEGIQAAQALDLIAPRIDAQGSVVATSGIHAVTGQAAMDYERREVSARGTAPEGPVLDSAFLGGMQAGRISIVSTDAGAGVNLEGVLKAQERVRIDSQGAVQLTGAELSAPKVVIQADRVSARPGVHQDKREKRGHDESWFIWQTGASDTVETVTETTLSRPALNGELVKVQARGAVQLAATDVRAEDIRITAGEVVLDGVADRDVTERDYFAWKNSWQRKERTEHEQLSYEGSLLDAQHVLQLNAAGRMSLQGAELKAGGQVRLQAGQTLALAGLIERTAKTEQGSRYLEGPELASGSWDRRDQHQQLKPTQVMAGQSVQLQAGGDISLEGSRLLAQGDISLRSGGDVALVAQVINQQEQVRDYGNHWGGIAGSQRHNDQKEQARHQPTQVLAQGKLMVSAEKDIRIVGSEAQGQQGAQADTRQGNLQIQHATDLTKSMVDQRTGGVFDIQTHRSLGSHGQDTVAAAAVMSESNLRLASGKDVAVSGSRVAATGALNVTAAGDVVLQAADQRTRDKQFDSQLMVNTALGQDPAQAGRYRAGLEIARHDQRVDAASLSPQAAEFSGASVQVAAQGDVRLTGSRIVATDGDVSVRGSNLAFDSAQGQSRSLQVNSEDSMGVSLMASNEQVQVAGQMRNRRETSDSEQQTPLGSQVSATGDLSLQAGSGVLRTRGGQFQAGGALSAEAGQIVNQAAPQSSSSRQETVQMQAGLTLDGQAGNLTKPVHQVLDQVKRGDWAGAVATARQIGNGLEQGLDKLAQGDWVGLASLLAQVTLPGASLEGKAGTSELTVRQSVQDALASRYQGGSVQITSHGSLTDQGTQYLATQGSAVLVAESLSATALATQRDESRQQRDNQGSFHASTMTGHDLNLKLGLGAGSQLQRSEQGGVQAGRIEGAKGVSLQLAGDAALQATRLDGGSGVLQVSAGGDLALTAASAQSRQAQRNDHGGIQASLTLSGDMDSPQFGGGGQINGEWQRQQGQQGGVQGSTLAAGGGVVLSAGQDLRLQAAQLGSAETPLSSVSLRAGGDLTLGSMSRHQQEDQQAGKVELGVNARVSTDAGAEFALKVGRDGSRQSDQQGTVIHADTVRLAAGGQLAGQSARVEAAQLSGEVGGNLALTSQTRQAEEQHFALDLGLSTPDLGELASGGGDLLRLKLSQRAQQSSAVRDPAVLAASAGADWQVGGTAQLQGAVMSAAGVPVSLDGRVQRTSLAGQENSRQLGLSLAGTPIGVAGTALTDVLSGKLPFGWQQERSQRDLTQPAR